VGDQVSGVVPPQSGAFARRTPLAPIRPLPVNWHEALGLHRQPLLGLEHQRSMPTWVATLMSLGYQMRALTAGTGVHVCCLMVPARQLSSAFVVLGALLNSAPEVSAALTWQELINLPLGSQLHVRVARGAGRSDIRVATFEGVSPRAGARVHVEGMARYEIFPPSLAQYEPGLAAFVDDLPHSRGIVDFYASLLGRRRATRWLAAKGTECVVVTAKAAWLRDIAETEIFADDSAISLQSALLRPSGRSGSRVMLDSTGAVNHPCELRLLDGPRAFAAAMAEPFLSNTVLLLDELELDQAQDQLEALASQRTTCDCRIQLPSWSFNGIQMSSFHIPGR
jgi:hypothetical protein